MIPENRALLYTDIVNQLERSYRVRSTSKERSLQQMIKGLEGTALQMEIDGAQMITLRNASRLLARRDLERLQELGLLVEVAPNNYKFVRSTLQSFFAARDLASTDDFLQVIAEHKELWPQVIPLLGEILVLEDRIKLQLLIQFLVEHQSEDDRIPELIHDITELQAKQGELE